MKQRFGFALLCTLSIFSGLAHAQGMGSIVGTVTDPSGAALVSAKVRATRPATGLTREAVANGDGYFVISALPPAQYSVTVEAKGFDTEKLDVAVLADQALTVNVKLKLGTSSEIVTVTGADLQVDTTSSTLKQVIERTRIIELPLDGRNTAELTLLTPGVVQAPLDNSLPTSDGGSGALQGVSKAFPGAIAISVNGSRQNQSSYMLDGGNNVDEYTNVNMPFPMPDALQEFSVQTSNYSAEYGQNAGGVVNVITNSGSNAFHGDLFEFVRNSIFNAKKWNSTTGKDQLKRNQFGGTIGGPIIHDRTFFFAGYQGTRLRNLGNALSEPVPTAAQRATATDPAVTKLLTYIPLGDSNGNVNFARPEHQDFNEFIGRVDHTLNRNDHLSVRYFYDHFARAALFDPQNILTYSDGSNILVQNALIHENHMFSTSLLNDFRFGFTREHAKRGPAAKAISVQDLGVTLPFYPAAKAIQRIQIGGILTGNGVGDNPTGTFVRTNFTWSDDVSRVVGKHDLRFGGVIERSRVDHNNTFNQPGIFKFKNVADFMAGKLHFFQQGFGEFENNRNTFVALYLQDNYKVNRRLTVNLGLRYEPSLPWHEIKGRVEQFRLSGLMQGAHSTVFPNAPAGVYFPGDAGVPSNGTRASLRNFSPRLGFAYDVFGDGKTSVRGGAGIFYDTRIPGISNNKFSDITPFSPQVTTFTGPFSDPYCANASTQAAFGCTAVPSPFPASLPPAKNSAFGTQLFVVSWDPNTKYQVPALYDWNLAIEHQASLGLLLRVAYVGSHGSHLRESLYLNPAVPSLTPVDPSNPFNARLNLLAGYDAFGVAAAGVFQNAQDINSSYHALQLSVEKRVSRGLTLLANYTWSKYIDDVPEMGGVTDIGSDSPSALPWDDPRRHSFDRGPSDYDHTHRFVASYVWQLPSLSSQGAMMRNVLGNWQFSGLVTAQTGRPFTALASGDVSNTGISMDRAFISGPAYGSGSCAANGVTTPCKDLLNPNSFSDPAPGTFGNIGKGALRFPGYYNWNMAATKNFQLTERFRLQFRFEFFNVFNRVNYLDDDNTVANVATNGGSNFGNIQNSYDPRIGQAALKLFF